MQTSESLEPAASIVLRDLEVIRALTDPLRLRIVETLVKEARTVKQLAKIVGVPPTKLYYHIAQLEEHGLIRVVDSRVVSGIIEKWYRSTASNYELDKTLLSFLRVDTEDTSLDTLIDSIFSITKEEIKQSVKAGTITLDEEEDNHHPTIIIRSVSRLTHERVHEFSAKLRELLKEFDTNESDEPEHPLYSLTLAYYPTVPPPLPDENETGS